MTSIKRHFSILTLLTIVYNSGLLIGLKFNCKMRNFLCPWCYAIWKYVQQFVLGLFFIFVCCFWCFVFTQESERHKIYLTIARKVTTNHEATTIAPILLTIANYDVRDAAYRFLSWTEDNCGPVEKWEKIVEAMKVLEKNTTVRELGLEERLTAAKRRMSVQHSVKSKVFNVQILYCITEI